MENKDKKVIKISLNKFIVIAVTTVIVLFVGVYLFAYKMKKPNSISDIEALINNGENTDEIAKKLFEKGANEIRKLQYSNFIKDEYEVTGSLIEKEINGRTYIKTNEKYEKVEQKYAEIFTEEALKNVLASRFANVDGVLYVSHGGATGWDITNVEVEKIKEKDGELTYRASYNDVNVDESINEERNSCELVIKKVDGEYRISSTNYCNIDKQEVNTNLEESIINQNETVDSNDNIEYEEEIKYPDTLDAIFTYDMDDINEDVSNRTSDITYMEIEESNPYTISQDRKSVIINGTTLKFTKQIYHVCIYPLGQGGSDMWAILLRDGNVKYSIDYGKTLKDGPDHIVDIFAVSYERDTGDDVISSLKESTILVANEFGKLIDLRIYNIEN